MSPGIAHPKRKRPTMTRAQYLYHQRRAARAEEALRMEVRRLRVIAEAKAKDRARRSRLSFTFKRARTVQRFGNGIVLNVTYNRGGDEYAQRRSRSRAINAALKAARLSYPRPVVTPEWIEEDRREEMRELSLLRWGAKL